MVDRILSVIALSLLIGFLFVLVWYVKRIDLTIVCLVVTLMAAYDFYDETVRRANSIVEKSRPDEQKDAI